MNPFVFKHVLQGLKRLESKKMRITAIVNEGCLDESEGEGYLDFEDVQRAYALKRIECPECGGKEHETNSGRSHNTLGFCCEACGTQFDAIDIAEVLP